MPALTGLLVDVLWWLESCRDEEADPDSAVKMMESVGWVLLQLPSDQRHRVLSGILGDLRPCSSRAYPQPPDWSSLVVVGVLSGFGRPRDGPGCAARGQTTGRPRQRTKADKTPSINALAGRFLDTRG